jgi:hypothetical protein
MITMVQELDWLEHHGLLDATQRVAIERALRQRLSERQTSPLFLMIYAVCGLVVLGALFTLLRSVWDSWQGTGVLWASSAMMATLVSVAWALWVRPALRAMAGTLATVGVCLACAAYAGLAGVMGLSLSMGDGTLWFTKGHWVWMWVWLAVVGCVTFRAMPFPLVVLPVLFAFFCLFVRGAYVAMGVTQLNPAPACWVACGYGMVMVVAGWCADRFTEWRVAPWFYTLGAVAVIRLLRGLVLSGVPTADRGVAVGGTVWAAVYDTGLSGLADGAAGSAVSAVLPSGLRDGLVGHGGPCLGRVG